MKSSPIEKPSVWSFPYFVDLVQDNTRCPALFTLCAALLFILVAVNFVGQTPQTDFPPLEIRTSLPLQDQYLINTPFTDQFPTPRIRVANQEGIQANVEVEIILTDLLTADDPTKPLCDAVTRGSIANTLEYIRMSEVCRVILYDYRNTTNKYGISQFNTFKIRRGPQGTYSFRFISPKFGTQSQDYQIFIKSQAASLLVDQTTPPPLQINYNQKFTKPPRVQVLDENHNPIANATVVAFSWPEPKFNGRQQPYLSQPHRYTWLDGNIEVTNNDGWVTFTDLTVQGSNNQFLYLHFAVDGLITQFWGISQPYYSSVLDKSTYFSNPILLNTNVKSLKFIGGSLTVQEDSNFADPIAVQVLGEKDVPIPSKVVFSRIIAANGEHFPLQYEPYRTGFQNKQLIKPIPGVYNVQSFNPLLSEDGLFPLVTDKNGKISFTDMQFNEYGQAGQYTLLIECEGVELLLPDITVQTSVASVKFYAQPPAFINTGEQYVGDVLIPIILIQNSQGQGIAGKTPIIRFFGMNEQGLPQLIEDELLSLELDYFNPNFTPSDEFGYCKLYFRFQMTAYVQITLFIEVEVDGFTARSNEFMIEAIYAPPYCGNILWADEGIIKNNYNLTLNIGVQQELDVYVMDQNGEQMFNQNVVLDSVYLGDTPTRFPDGVFQSFRSFSAKTSEEGISKISNFQLDKGAKGHIYLRAMTFSLTPLAGKSESALINQDQSNIDGLESQRQTIAQLEYDGKVKVCYSRRLRIELISKISQIQIYQITEIDSTNKPTTKLFQLSIDENTAKNNIFYTFSAQDTTNYLYEVKLQMLSQQLDGSLKPLANEKVVISLTTMMVPPFLIGDSTKAISIINDNGNLDAQGFITLQIQITRGAIGVYGVIFTSGGVFSKILIFTAEDKAYGAFTSLTFQTTQELAVPTASKTLLLVGTMLNQGVVTLKYGNNIPVISAQVIASINRVDPSSQVFLDITDIGLGNSMLEDYYFVGSDPRAVFASTLRLGITDSNGIANFLKLSVVDVQSNTNQNTCVTYQVHIGQSDSYYSQGSYKSDELGKSQFCFSSNKKVEISNQKYTKVISLGNKMPVPLKIRITKTVKSDYDDLGIILYSAMPLQINNYYPSNPFEISKLYFQDFICMYFAKVAIKDLSSKTCTSQITIQGNGPFFYEIEFTGLKWVQAADKVKFKVTLSDPLNFNVVKTDPNTQSTQIVSTLEADYSNYIAVSNTPALITIITQPPDVVTTGDSFLVEVQVKIASGLPVVRGLVSAVVSIDPTNVGTMLNSQYKNMLFIVAQGSIKASSVAQLTKQSNVMLQASSSNDKTNKRGFASFNLMVVAGMEGQYTINFQAGNVKSDNSVSFLLVNRIKKIEFVTQPDSTVADFFPDEAEDEAAFIPFDQKVQLQLKFMNDLIFLGEKQIQVKIYNYIEPAILRKIAEDAGLVYGSVPIEILLREFSESPDQLQVDAKTTLSNTLNAVLNGGQVVPAVSEMALPITVNFEYPEEYSNGTLIFTKLEVQWKAYGDYMMVFVINGKESLPSTKISIVAQDPSISQQLQDASETIIILVVVFCVMIGSTPFNHWCWTVAGFIACVIAEFLIIGSEKPLFWKILVWVDIFIIIVMLLYLFVRLYKRIKKNDLSILFPYDLRDELFHEYTYQAIFNQPSFYWISSKANGEPYALPYMNYSQPIITQEHIQKFKKFNKYDDIVETYDIVSGKHKSKSVCAQMKKIFTPLSSAYQQIIIGDCFYYPSRIQTAILTSVIACVFLSVTVFAFTTQIDDYLELLNAEIKSANYIIMFAALNAMKSTFQGEDIPENIYISSENDVEFLMKQINIIGIAVQNALYVACTIATIQFFCSMVLLLYDFKDRMMKYREGEVNFLVDRTDFTDVPGFMGTVIANSLVSFLILIISFGIIFTILFHPLFWQVLDENLPIFLGLLLSSTVGLWIFQKIAEKFLIDPIQGIKHRRIYSIYELFMVYMSVVAGLLGAVFRIIILMFALLIGLTRVDQPMYPDWINNAMYLDEINTTYLALVSMTHMHNHPISITFTNYSLFIMALQQQKLQKQKVYNLEEAKDLPQENIDDQKQLAIPKKRIF